MRYSFSRLSTYRTCPRQWMYRYIENLDSFDNEESLLGNIFHEMIEEYYNPKKEKVAAKRYKEAVENGLIEKPIDFLETILGYYIGHYASQDANEMIIAVEAKLTVDLNDPKSLMPGEEHDVVYGKIDKVISHNGLVGIRDTKSTVNKLKYTPDMVRYNPQLLLYAGMYDEMAQASIIDFIEIDEVRLAELQPVPLNQNGKPTGAWNKLGLVTFEAYRSKLEELDLLDDPSYASVLDRLERRGHPLFKRVRIYLNDKEIMEESLQDIVKTYQMVKYAQTNPEVGFPRHRGFLCDWCSYKELCQADFFPMGEEERKMFTEKFSERVDKE